MWYFVANSSKETGTVTFSSWLATREKGERSTLGVAMSVSNDHSSIAEIYIIDIKAQKLRRCKQR